eukprot:TRINITY_DN7667_c0_g1_i2.p1 TRINITY_DN7667_c0_g1~~TRINITY_DN7667_c0_g1_i2.p1  ORF type:complete len:235 (+),score=-6.42 TRINITY_DN7667_c0_g1_i2:30-707(+)
MDENSYDWGSLILLCLLYTVQGIPVALGFSTMPLLLKSKASYTVIGLFTMSTYPYSLKILWSPIVDSIFSGTFGRRKSWVIPTQLITGFLMLYISSSIDNLLNESPLPIDYITGIFFIFILLAATQDIAVDGWGLDMFINHPNLASTCQTIGLSVGGFISYTIFLALNSAEFCNKYLRSEQSDVGMVTVGSYLQFWGIFYCVFSLLLFLKKEPSPNNLPRNGNCW